MKTIAITFAILISSIFSFAQEKTNYNITVTVNNVKNDTGKVMLTLHTKNTFLVADGIQSIETTIKEGKIKATFKDVTPGTYAILILHDENENKKMDFDTNKMTLEDYAMSNNPLSYGPPQYSDAKFEVLNQDLEMQIRF
ncbi:DUF2141 domain-containing protein [Lacinutrix jangbogonensis]|uniref:DUF2141 domain-containing protein n=1 Tax=Lacinutrix jangbogonensis TaxID=1469557 RepID=UPI00053E9657|nr:DUF2141 domain-containing protein [Lacinutrix jangbogonensis]